MLTLLLADVRSAEVCRSRCLFLLVPGDWFRQDSADPCTKMQMARVVLVITAFFRFVSSASIPSEVGNQPTE